MNSCLYDGSIVHARFLPKRHYFRYRLFLFYIDLDEIGQLEQNLFLFSYNRFNTYSLKDADHLQEGASSIKDNVIRYAEQKMPHVKVDKVYLLTLLRTWGHVFNPVSFYFLEDTAAKPVGAIAEVANTFNEQKIYYLPEQNFSEGIYRDIQKKYFYISPFSELDVNLRFKLSVPNETLNVVVSETNHDEQLIFYSRLSGKRQPLSNRALFNLTMRFPLITLQTVWGIYWQALCLWMKQIPYYSKKEGIEKQREVRPYLRK